jgi:putative FmdB family regulatory protein
MPLYEYDCRGCSTHFEVLVRGSETPECPSCHGTDLERALSTFAVNAPGPRHAGPVPGPCGRCGDPRGPGACSLN